MAAQVIVVGAGVAGLSTALALAPRPVLLLDAARDGSHAATRLAQGGIAAALGEGDTPAAHARDTLGAGAQYNDASHVQVLVTGAASAIEWLQRHGVVFDRDGKRLALAREGGHGCARVVHAGGDATGAAVLSALTAAARKAVHIDWYDGHRARALLLRAGTVVGVRCDAGHGGIDLYGEVVLATGGLGGLYARTTNPASAQGVGLALGLAAGATVRDLEFVQFHPTALDLPGRARLPLLTEALRGAGARLLDASGKSVMRGLHPLGDLAPRDVVSRAVWRAQHHGQVWLDATGVADVGRHFPTVQTLCREHGFDLSVAPVSVTPAAHFHMGGLAADSWGATSVRGLHAVGEVACNGVHGANRLASNSLLEGVVFGRRLGARLRLASSQANAFGYDAVAALGEGADEAGLQRLRERMWRACGPMRDGEALRTALRECTDDPTGWQGRVADRLLSAAIARRRSLGAHHRLDTVVAAGVVV